MEIWKSTGDLAACKVAVAGDFLPAGMLQAPDPDTSISMADSLRTVLEDAGVVFVNLECPIDVAGLDTAPKPGIGALLQAPQQVLRYLARLKAVPVGLANNHIFDYGVAGLERTREAVQAAGMVPLGCGRTTSEKPEVLVWQSPSGVKVGFWAAARITSQTATATQIGTEPATLQRANMALRALRDQGAQCCIALLHAGLERTNYPEPADVALMDSLAAAGYSLVAACHSHRISGYRLLQTKRATAACFYGLGSISSGMMYGPLEREGIAVILSLGARGELLRIDAKPVALSDSGWGLVPSPEQETVILSRFRAISAHITDGTYSHLFYRDISKNLFVRQLRDLRAAYEHAGITGVVQKLGRARFRHLNRAIHGLMQ